MTENHHRPVAATVLALVSGLSGILLLIGCLSPSRVPAEAAQQPNIIFIMVDALRHDHLSVYGYERPTTPNLDLYVARQGLRFDDATSPSSWTYPANAAIMTGRAASRIGLEWNNDNTHIPAEQNMLAEYLKTAGYTTAGFTNAYYTWPRFGFDQGYDTYEAVLTGPNGDAAKVNERAEQWLDTVWAPSLKDKPLYLYLYYYDPHTIYDPPPPYHVMYDSTYTGTLTGEVYQNGEIVVSGAYTPTERDVQHLKALYDGEITYWDAQFKQMMDYLGEQGILDNAIIVVTSDHGQMFGEHGEWTHHNALYEEVVRVPLLFSWPDAPPGGAVITDSVSTMDIVPTLLDLLDIRPYNYLDGRSLLPALQGRSIEANRSIFSEVSGETDPTNHHYWNSPLYELRSLKVDGWKYIMEIGHAEGDALYLVGPVSVYETENLRADNPARAQSYYNRLFDWFNLPTEFTYIPLAKGGG